MNNRYPAYKPSGLEWLDDIPEHWDIRRLGDALSAAVSGGTPSTTNEVYWAKEDEEGLPWVAIADMSSVGQVVTTAKRVTPRGLAAARLQLLPPGTIIYSMYASVGAVARLSTPAVTNQAILGLIPKDTLESSFLYWWLTGIRKHVTALTRNNTQSNLNLETVCKIPLALPPFAEQRAIANYLDAETARIDTLISKKRRLIALLTERKALSADNALDRLRESDPLIPLKYLVCESDVRCETNNELELLLVSIHRGVIPKRLGSNNQTASEDLSKYKVVSPGDIVVNRMRAFQGGLGVAPQPGIVSPDYTVLRVGAQVSPEFLHYLLRSSWFVSEMTRRLRGIGATGQGQVRTPRINFGDLGQIEVPVPPGTVQEEIAFNLSAREAQLTRLVDLQTKQLTLLEEKRQATITAGVTGEINVATRDMSAEEQFCT